MAQGTTVTITVSRGKQIKNVTMANLVGKTESEARQWLENNGLKANVSYTTSSGTYGYVVSSDYSEGTSVPEGTTVTVTVSHKQEEQTKATEPTKATESTKVTEATKATDAAQN